MADMGGDPDHDFAFGIIQLGYPDRQESRSNEAKADGIRAIAVFKISLTDLIAFFDSCDHATEVHQWSVVCVQCANIESTCRRAVFLWGLKEFHSP